MVRDCPESKHDARELDHSTQAKVRVTHHSFIIGRLHEINATYHLLGWIWTEIAVAKENIGEQV